MSPTAAFSPLPSEVTEAFALAAITALREQTQLTAYQEKSPSRVGDQPTETIVFAKLSLRRQLPGAMVLVMAVESATQLATQYLPQGTELTDTIIDDVAGEFANLIAGHAKTILKGTLYHFSMSPPVVARAAHLSHVPDLEGHAPIAVLNFDSGRLLIWVDLCPCPGA